MKIIFIFLLANLAAGNVYLHSPRGSNNRLNEDSAENENNERLFYSNNNRRGGYNVGDKSKNPFGDEAGQYSMQYFQSGLDGKSYLTVEWTNQLGCGEDEDGDKIHNCNIIIQTNCQTDEVDGVPPEDSYTLRNGKITDRMPYDPNLADVAVESREEKNERRSVSLNHRIGLHESWEYYDRCDPTFGERYGMECLSEREKWPDNDISPWADIAFFTNEPENDCSEGIADLNSREFYECIEYFDPAVQLRKHKSSYTSRSKCINNGGDWLGFYKVGDVRNDIGSKSECMNLNDGVKEHVWGRPMIWKDLADDKLTDETCIALPSKVECLKTPNTRPNYLGDVDGERSAPRFQWKLPHHEEDKRCVFRIRYIVTTDDEAITGHNRKVYPFSNDGIALALTQRKVVFEDRSHIFKLLQRPEEISDQLNIHNLVVRGKRGNIAQTYPAVEYDFVPNRLTIPEGDGIHVQWTGSNTHYNDDPGGDGQTGDAGEGRSGSDRHNFIQLIDRVGNLVAPDHNHTLFENANWVWSSHEKGKPENEAFNLALGMATSGYYQCEDDEECTEAYDNSLNDQLNNAPASYHGNLFVPISGEYHYKCMRNDNFSNRSQKGSITVLS